MYRNVIDLYHDVLQFVELSFVRVFPDWLFVCVTNCRYSDAYICRRFEWLVVVDCTLRDLIWYALCEVLGNHECGIDLGISVTLLMSFVDKL